MRMVLAARGQESLEGQLRGLCDGNPFPQEMPLLPHERWDSSTRAKTTGSAFMICATNDGQGFSQLSGLADRNLIGVRKIVILN